MPMIPSDLDAMHAYMLAHPKAERPDFDKLRKERNASFDAMVSKLCEEYGWNRDEIRHTHNYKACYCNCGDHGVDIGTYRRLCEHVWCGPIIELDQGQTITSTCIYCKMPAIHHDMRNAP